MRRASIILLGLSATTGIVAIGGGGGCSDKLETGYTPNRLNATPQQRKAYYAAPFSPESREAPDRDAALEARRPRPGY